MKGLQGKGFLELLPDEYVKDQGIDTTDFYRF